MQEYQRCALIAVSSTVDGELTSMALQRAGYETTVAARIADALRLARNNFYTLIVTDWNFEDGSGVDLCRMIREFDSETMILFSWDQASREEVDEAMTAGAQGFFTSMTDRGRLAQEIRSQF